MQLAGSERQMVHSSYCSSLCPLISYPWSPSSFSAFDNPKILLISNGNPFIYKDNNTFNENEMKKELIVISG